MRRAARIALVCAGAAVALAAAMRLSPDTGGTVDVQLLAMNDFHGALEPPAGGTGRVGDVEAGGIEYLATHVARLKAANPNTLIVSAGDNIGGAPLLSSLFHDEITIEALNTLGLQASALGNHDLDEGWWELYRMQKGGCHPVDGCQDGSPYAGAAFPYLAANVRLDPRQVDPAVLAWAGIEGLEPRALLPASAVREVGGVRIGFIGAILEEAPSVVIPTSLRGLTFLPEAPAINAAARELVSQGVRAIVLLIHEGGDPTHEDINGCEGLSADFVALVNALDPEIDAVVSGHRHFAYNCTMNGKVVTSAAANGRLLTDIDLRIDRATGDVVAGAARNLIVTRDVPRDQAQSALLARYRPLAKDVGARVVGSVTESLTRIETAAGESVLGRAMADIVLQAGRAAPGGAAELAMMNPGGLRADLVSAVPARPVPVTYAALFEVLPFGNEIVVKSVSGAAILDALEQQFGPERTRIMQVSDGFTYAYDSTRPRGQRIDRSSVRVNGAPLDPARQYRLATNSFLWSGGDGLAALVSGTNPVTLGVDIDVVAEYFARHSPVHPSTRERIRRGR